MYAQIIDEKTKLCSVGVGTNTDFYKSIGMVDMEVEQGYDGQWYVKGYAPNQPLEELKQAKINEFKAIRDSEEVKPIEYDSHLFDYDEKSRDRINSAIIALEVNGQATAIEWTLADNTNTLVTCRDLIGVVANVASRSNQLHIKYRELKELVEACTTKEEVDNISWE